MLLILLPADKGRYIQVFAIYRRVCIIKFEGWFWCFRLQCFSGQRCRFLLLGKYRCIDLFLYFPCMALCWYDNLVHCRFAISDVLSLVETSSDNRYADFITKGGVDNSTKDDIGIFSCFFKYDVGRSIHFQ